MTNVGIILKNRRLVNILFRFFAEIRSLRLDDQVDELILDENDLDDLHPIERLGDLLDLTGGLDDGILLAVHRHGDGALELAVDLHRHLGVGGDGLALVVLRPGHLHGHLAVLSGTAKLLPQLLDHVRREGREHEQQLLKIAAGEAVGVELVDHRHERGDGGVHLERVDVVRDLLDGLVDDGLVLLGNGLVRRRHLCEVPHAVEEALAALHRVVGPGRDLFKVADEHDSAESL